MATSTASRVLSRLSSRLQPLALKFGTKKASLPPSLSSSQSAPKRVSRISRLPVELSGVETMLPLHSAIASARLTSSLAVESRTWGLVPQGLKSSVCALQGVLRLFVAYSCFHSSNKVMLELHVSRRFDPPIVSSFLFRNLNVSSTLAWVKGYLVLPLVNQP
ncbi:hypothetical protein ACH5RR_005985 [Cinchona calisaya]|uniref:Uncharacterized protein n=1 Tax=Cinchona calisaya TaxID=153742 RepID=A0ABD3AMR5_9GENT